LKYYKIISGQLFVGIATTSELRKIQSKHNILVECKEREAQCVQCNEYYYHAGWMLPIPENVGAIFAQVIEIDKEEYDYLYELIDGDEDIPDPEPPEPEPEPIEPDSDITVEYARKLKTEQMEKYKDNILYEGIDVILPDGTASHFRLRTGDQLYLFRLELMANNGAEKIAYHSDDDLCKYYTREEILSITGQVLPYITYHETYFNSLKYYINHYLDTVADIANVYYGMDIPEESQSEVWNDIINGKINADSI